MSLRTLLIGQAVFEIGWGLSVLLIPAQVLAPTGAMLTEPEGILFARMFGVAIISIGYLSWSLRDATASIFPENVVPTFLLFQTLLFIVLLIAQIIGVRDAWGWSVVILHLLLSLGFGYYLERTDFSRG